MPLYEYKCSGCGRLFDKFYEVSKYQESPECQSCYSLSTRIFTPIYHRSFIIEPYYDYGLGQVIRTSNERKQVMKEKGLEEAHGIKREDFNKKMIDPFDEKRKMEKKKKESVDFMNYLEDHGVPEAPL